jgi:hypothetical protein
MTYASGNRTEPEQHENIVPPQRMMATIPRMVRSQTILESNLTVFHLFRA